MSIRDIFQKHFKRIFPTQNFVVKISFQSWVHHYLICIKTLCRVKDDVTLYKKYYLYVQSIFSKTNELLHEVHIMLTNKNVITAVLGERTLITGTIQHFTLWKTESQWLNGKKDEALTTWWTVYHYPQALISAWNFSPLICMLGLENTLLYVFRALHYFANPFLQTSRSQVTCKNKRICNTWNELTGRVTEMIWM